ncbi:hypothetical protein CI109_102117 [Kwoniella shandongensis]|uniref:amidase n=1 Tax=Kwoniella shandongensis TaxID=1734106 RepID=A0A5M6BQ34_9TREE|nr:uncharacterized protein CI109_007429 [Kwoniella shandongensis]KAA5524232.1 hypothetical protein CI109_007429 [Kwoniella shandongensis]
MGGNITKEVGQRKRDEREELINEMEKQLGLAEDHPDDAVYTHTSPEEIVANLKSRKNGWTAERVMIAFIRSACAAHRKTNCLTEILFAEALEEARKLDKDYAATGIADGPFWGLPSSFKDTYNIKGVDTSLGCSPHCFKPTEKLEDEGGLVQLFRQGGGIPFCKTNIPQTLLAFECRNPVFGPTTNPYTSARTCGGSSGGEAALIALNGSPMGWGSDIGGSLRIPASYSGVCGLKPVKGRWPTKGQRSATPGFEGIQGIVGPMGRNVDDLAFGARNMLTLAQESTARINGEQLIHMPWKEVELPKKLRVGYFTEDNCIKASPACVRAVEESVAALRKAGHEVVRFEPPDVSEALKVFAGLTSADGYKTLLGNIGPDPMEPSMRLVTIGSRIPRWLAWFAHWLLDSVLKDHMFASTFATSRPKSVEEFWKYTRRRDVYANAFRKLVWEDKKFDMILCPVQAVPAVEHGRTNFLSPLCIGTVLYNVVDSTVGVIPVTHVDRERDATPPDYLEGSQGSWLLEKRVYEGGPEKAAYDAEKMHGLPVGVQIVGQAWEEEKVLAIMKVVEELVAYEP